MQGAVHTQTRSSARFGSRNGRRSKPCRNLQVRAASASTAPQTGIITRLIGQQLFKMDLHHSIVPLLSSDEHQLPFAAALHIYHPQQERQASSDDSAMQQNRSHKVQQQHSNIPTPLTGAVLCDDGNGSNTAALPPVVELMYVLSGSGFFSSSTGSSQRISSGDSVIAMQQQITFAAGAPLSAADTLQASQATQQAPPTADFAGQASSTGRSRSSNAREALPLWRNLVPWLQLQHLPSKASPDSQPQQQQSHPQPEQQDSQLVMLQLLLPSELLTGELDHHNAAHCQAVAQHLPWSNKHGVLQPEGCIDQRSVCKLLVGAQQLPQQQQQHNEPQQPQQAVRPQQPSVADHVSSSSSSSTTEHAAASNHVAIRNSSSSSSSDNHPSRPLFSPQQVLKRGLSEVGSFQLPAQTNRLALLFGPHASPAVCLSFGVEVFEPGHVTPLHIHTSAHELFFVLAGSGVAVHGPEGREQRVELSAGDVAVFPPGVLHGIDNLSDQQLYCLQMMLPNESFVEWVRSGQAAGTLDVGALQRLAAAASCG